MYKKVIIKLFKKAIFLILPTYLLWFLYIQYMPMYYNSANNTRWYFIKKSLEKEYKIPKSDYIFLGESRVNAGFDFTKIPNSYSFASGGATSIEMYYVLNKYLKNHSKPKKVFISISPRFLSEVFAFYPYFIRNKLISFSEMQEICSNLQKGDNTLGKAPMRKYILHKLGYLVYYQNDIKENNVFGANYKNKEMINEMIKMHGGRFHPNLKISSSELNEETKCKRFKPSKIISIYLDKIFQLCKQEKIDVEFYFMPMNESSYKELNPMFIKEYKSYIKEYQKKYPKFNISDSMFFYKDIFFGDASHLNKNGKKVFTSNFIKTHLKK
jgi:hypothetical protein